MRSDGCDKVVMIELFRKNSRWTLLGVGSEFVFQVAPEGSYETGRCSHGPARFDTTEPGGHRSATGVASYPEMFGVYFFSC